MVTREPDRGRPLLPRILAPLAFFAAVTVLVLLVQSSLEGAEPAADEPAAPAVGNGEGAAPDGEEGGADGGEEGEEGQQGQQGQEGQQGQDGEQQQRFYRIRQGDTLEAIAVRFDTTVDDLLQLNPNVEPNALTPGQRIRIR